LGVDWRDLLPRYYLWWVRDAWFAGLSVAPIGAGDGSRFDLLIYSKRHLESVLGTYVRHYNESRPHRGRKLATPLLGHEQPRTGEVCRRDILGGIIHEYDRAA